MLLQLFKKALSTERSGPEAFRPMDLCEALIRTTSDLSALLGVESPHISKSTEHLLRLRVGLNSLYNPRFDGHAPIAPGKLSRLIDHLETIEWLIERLSQPNFSPDKIIGVANESGELIVATAKHYISARVIESEVNNLRDQIKVVREALPPAAKTTHSPIPHITKLNEIRQKLEAFGSRLPDLSPDQDAVGERRNSLERSTESSSGHFLANMNSFGNGTNFTEQTAGRIIGPSHHLKMRLGVRIPAVITDSDGSACDLFELVPSKIAELPELAPLITKKSVANYSESDKRNSIIEYPLKHANSRLPLPPNFEVLALAYLDYFGREISPHDNVEVTSSAFGGISINPPPNAVTARYTIRPTEINLPQETLEALRKLTSSSEFYIPFTTRRLIEASCQLYAKDPEMRSQFLFRVVKSLEFVPSHDQQIAQVINQSGLARNEVIAGLGCGNCMPLNYHLTALLNRADIPAILIIGDPITEQGEFMVNPGHAQVLVPKSKSPSVFDLTNYLATHLTVRISNISGDEWQSYIHDIQNGTLRDAYIKAREIRERLILQVRGGPATEASSGVSSGAGSFGGGSGAPSFNPLPGSSTVRPINFKPVTDLKEDKELDKLAYYLRAKIFIDEFQLLARLGLNAGDLSELYRLYDQETSPPSLEWYIKEELPPEFQAYSSFRPGRTIRELSNAVLRDPDFPEAGKLVSSRWLLRGFEPNLHSIPVHQNLRSRMLTNYYNMVEPAESTMHSLRSSAADLELDTLIAFSSKEAVASAIESALTKIYAHRICLSNGISTPEERYSVSHEALAKDLPAVKILRDVVIGGRRGRLEISDEQLRSTLVATIALLCDSYHTVPDQLTRFSRTLFKIEHHRDPTPCQVLLDELRSCCLDILKELADDSTRLLPLLLIETGGFSRPAILSSFKWFFNSFSNLQGEGSTSLPQYSVLSKFSAQITELLVGNAVRYFTDSYRFEVALPFLSEIGVTLDLKQHADKLKSAIIAANAHDHTPKFNLPLGENHSSRVLVSIITSSRTAMLRSTQAISVAVSGDAETFTREAWPVVDETEVDHALLKGLRFTSDSLYFMQGFRFGYYENRDKSSVSPADVPNIVRDVLKDKPYASLAATIIERKESERASLGRSISRLKDLYPAEWEQMIGACIIDFEARGGQFKREAVRDLALRVALNLTEDWSYWDRYIGLLGAYRLFAYVDDTQDNSGRSWERKLQLEDNAKAPVLELIDKWSAEAAGVADLTVVAEKFPLNSRLSRIADQVYSHLPVERWMVGVLAFAIAHEGKAKDTFSEQSISRSIRLDLAADIVSDDRVVGLWRCMISYDTSSSSYMPIVDAILRLRKIKQTNNKVRSARRALYLSSGASSVRIPVPSGGEFEELRLMSTGDDIRRVDWRAYGRTDRLTIRKYVDIEPERGIFIIDMEWLADNFEHSRRTSDGPCRLSLNLRSLFIELFQSVNQGYYPHLILCVRGDLVRHLSPAELEDNLKHSELPTSESDRGWSRDFHYHDEKFIYRLISALDKVSGYSKSESWMRPEGFYPTSVARHIPQSVLASLPKRSKIIFAAHRRNRDASIGYIRALARHLGGHATELDTSRYV